MSKIENLKGKTFGYLTVISLDNNPLNKRIKWICQCKCGKTTSVFAHSLKSGKTQSCGCKRFESHNKKHGMKHTRIYEIWCGMKKRCYNPHSKSYEHYGNKGITVCNEWLHNFENFYKWSILNGYNDNLQIDRIDTNGNYTPKNCRWITHAEQQRNKTNNIYLEHNGETKTLSEWCKIMGEPYHKIHGRIKSAMYHYGKFDFDDLFFPKKKEKIYTELFYNRKHYSKKIAQYSIDGQFIKFWNSTVEASESGFNRTAITNCLTGRSKTSGGYIWKYAED
jgi:hypothetical protein